MMKKKTINLLQAVDTEDNYKLTCMAVIGTPTVAEVCEALSFIFDECDDEDYPEYYEKAKQICTFAECVKIGTYEIFWEATTLYEHEEYPLMDEKLIIAFKYKRKEYECLINRDRDLTYDCPGYWDAWLDLYDKNGEEITDPVFRLTGRTNEDGKPILDMSISVVALGSNEVKYIEDIKIRENVRI